MPVIPYQTNLFQDRKLLHQFLKDCQQKSIQKNQPQIASITIEIDAVDPLAALHAILELDQPHFYLEKSFDQEAIAAVGCAMKLETEGRQRFLKAQNFIQQGLNNLISAVPLALATAPPKFFCSFTFFDQPSNAESAFSGATVFLPQWQIVRQGDRSFVVANLSIDKKSDIEAVMATAWQKFKKICSAQYGIFNLTSDLRLPFQDWNIVDTNNFKAAVISALDFIQANHLNKLVLAHAVDIFSQLPIQWIHALHNLRKLHPDCYIFSTSNGKAKTFIGASPERLLSIKNYHLGTDALAGSAPRGQTVTEDAHLANRLLSSEKERREHQVVVDFITQRLLRLGLQPQMADLPRLFQLSNIQHLHTPIQTAIPAHLHPLEIVAELHPTPAVAGMPRDLACQKIRQYEAFERSLYAAPLGWVDSQDNAEFIVGIRSALIEGCHARLYAGAGIVAGSDPEKELAEIQLKLQALMQALV